MTVLALGLLVLGLLACLYVLVGSPAEAQATGSPAGTTPGSASGSIPPPMSGPLPPPATHTPSRPLAAPAPTDDFSQQQPVRPLRRHSLTPYAPPVASAEASPVPTSALSAPTDSRPSELTTELTAAREQRTQAQELLHQATQSEHRIRQASALFLAVFAIIAAIIVIQVYIQARGWDRETMRSGEELETLRGEVEALRSRGREFRNALPAWLQEVGEQPLSYQEEGTPFAPRALAMIEDIDDLAYIGQGRLAFRDLPSPSEAAVYLNGLLLSAVAHLSRSDPWTAFARLDLFFLQLSQFPDAVERLRIAQGYSYRALAAYQVLDAQDREPSWLRKAERTQLEALSRQAFADVAHATSVDPEWKHATFVEALLCSRFYLAEENADSGSRSDLLVRGLRRSVTLYKELIDQRSYRGPSRRNLIRSLKQIAEHTGDKSDFSDFGYALNAFPNDEELADEALAARQPNSQDRFLWQWMLGDEELFARVDRLNLAEYRSFWIRMLDNKVHLRNWRADLTELQQSRPAMKDWAIQLLQAEPQLSLSHAIARRQERYDNSIAATEESRTRPGHAG